jgi:hypothetical protein
LQIKRLPGIAEDCQISKLKGNTLVCHSRRLMDANQVQSFGPPLHANGRKYRMQEFAASEGGWFF